MESVFQRWVESLIFDSASSPIPKIFLIAAEYEVVEILMMSSLSCSGEKEF